MRLFRRSRKADLNLSVQAIVVIIFAIIMLGLGLGLITGIFNIGSKKIRDMANLADLAIQKPNADNPVTITSSVGIKFRGNAGVQVAFYNFESNALYGVTPKIKQCLTSEGVNVDSASLPTIAASTRDNVQPGNSEAWTTLMDLPGKEAGKISSDGVFSGGALIPGQYICTVGMYGCESEGCKVDFTKDLLKATDFNLEVTS